VRDYYRVMTEKITKNLIAISILTSAIIIGGAVIYINPSFLKMGTVAVLTPQKAGEKAIKYINEGLLKGAATASLMNTSEEDGVYKLHFKIAEKEYDSYVTKDGKVFFVEGLKTEGAQSSPTPSPTAVDNQIQKLDNPDVKLFVMSYCPYGLQAEKAFLPVYDLLKSKATMGIYFVSYVMHGQKELDENLKQYCIQTEEPNKFASYLNCFVKNGDSEKCSTEAKIDSAKISACSLATDKQYNLSKNFSDKSTWLGGQYPPFDIQKDLNEKYGVQGSPTLVINNKVVSVDRSPESFKKAICEAFNNAPQECSQALSTTSVSSGFGEGTGSSSGGGCGQ